MKTVPKVQEPLLQKFHYDQAQWMLLSTMQKRVNGSHKHNTLKKKLLSTFIAGLSGNPGQHIRFKMPATVDQALHIAITVFEAEAQEKRFLTFFSNSKTHRKGRGNFGQPWNSFGSSEYDQDDRTSADAPHAGRKHRQQYDHPTDTTQL